MSAWGRHLTKVTLKRSTDSFRGHIQQPQEQTLATEKRCDYFITWLMKDECSSELFQWEYYIFWCLNKFSRIMKHLPEQSWRTEYHEILKVSPASLTQSVCLGESWICKGLLLSFYQFIYVPWKPEHFIREWRLNQDREVTFDFL